MAEERIIKEEMTYNLIPSSFLPHLFTNVLFSDLGRIWVILRFHGWIISCVCLVCLDRNLKIIMRDSVAQQSYTVFMFQRLLSFHSCNKLKFLMKGRDFLPFLSHNLYLRRVAHLLYLFIFLLLFRPTSFAQSFHTLSSQLWLMKFSSGISCIDRLDWYRMMEVVDPFRQNKRVAEK